MIVMKFGGSSLATADRIKHMADIIEENIAEKPIVVVSAISKTTDMLLEAGLQALKGEVDISNIRRIHYELCEGLSIDRHQLLDLFDELNDLLVGISLIKEFSPKIKDYLVSFGERLSVRIIAPYLTSRNIEAKSFDAFDVGFRTNSNFSNAEVLEESYSLIKEAFRELSMDYEYTPIVTGFIAKDAEGSITTLGRGGSDLTASVLGAALDVDEIQVWKDVDGILSTDPKIVEQAISLERISFEEASELAHFGAKVLHPRSILPAMTRNIAVRVKNSYNPKHVGTLIVREIVDQKRMIKTITCKRNITLIDIVSTRMLGQSGFLSTVFNLFAKYKVSIDMIATSDISISLTLDNGHNLNGLREELEKIASVNISKNKSIVSIICDVRFSSKILDEIFTMLNRENINVQMISQGASKVNIGFIVEDNQAETCVKEIHKLFFE